MITLYQFKPTFNLPNASPFCMKVETFLKLAGLPYTVEILHDPRKAPKGKLPYITDGKTSVADSTLIVQYLTKTYGKDLNQHLSTEEKALSHAMKIMMEEHLYWVTLYSRWVDERYWPATREAFFGHLPPLIKNLVPKLIQESMKKQLHAQGTGRHTPDEIYAMGKLGIDALATFLADKPYLMGDRISEVDATAYAFAANLIVPPLDTPLAITARAHPNLVDYCARIKAQYFND